MSFAERVLQSPKTPRSKLRFGPDRMSPLIKTSMPNSPVKKSSPSSPFLSRKSPISRSSISLITSSPIKKVEVRKDLPTKPFLTMDVNGIPSNFYQNPIDWSKKNCVGIVNGRRPTVISLDNCGVLPFYFPYGDCLSFHFSPDGDYASVGSEAGVISVFDLVEGKIVSSIQNSNAAVNCIDQNDNSLICIQNDGIVSIIDTREDTASPVLIQAHDGYGITVKISPDGNRFISTAEDFIVKVWDFRNLTKSFLEYKESKSSVRAVEWSPIDSDIVCIGGGTGDRNIRLFSIVNGETTSTTSVGAQICNLFWNKDYNEIVSTHGFSDFNISLWQGKDLKHITTYHANHDRVLYAALSADKSKIVTASPLDPLMFWLMFPRSEQKSAVSTKEIR